MLLSGIRIGELCALRWDNVNLQEKTIRISATLQRLRCMEGENKNRTHIVIGAPKSATSIRTIPLTDHAAELCRKFAVYNGNAYILTGTEKYMEPRMLQYRIEKYTKECGLKGVHAHTLRHTFATRAVEVGFEIKSLSEITYKTALLIGIFQVIAAIFPGTSRSGATIVGALLIGVSRTVAAEYTFFLAIPVMFGASLLKVVKFGFSFTALELGVLITGTLVSFAVSLFAVRFLMGYVKKHDFQMFGWYRIILGAIVLTLGAVGFLKV